MIFVRYHKIIKQSNLNILLATLVVFVSPQCANGLTDNEVSKFQVTGLYDASVSLNDTSPEYYTITASGLPDHPWKKVNPNIPTNQNYNLKIPKTPKEATTKACLPFGLIGLTRTGVAIFNPLTIESLNAVEGPNAEIFDSCDGHPTRTGIYHYHKIPDSCLYQNTVDEFIGVAFDGYPIYGPNTSDIPGRWLTSDDLDHCHGRYTNGEYRYHATETFPYFLGCYHGEVYRDTARVTYNCSLTQNDWNEWTHYLCQCTAGPEPTGQPPTLSLSLGTGNSSPCKSSNYEHIATALTIMLYFI